MRMSNWKLSTLRAFYAAFFQACFILIEPSLRTSDTFARWNRYLSGMAQECAQAGSDMSKQTEKLEATAASNGEYLGIPLSESCMRQLPGSMIRKLSTALLKANGADTTEWYWNLVPEFSNEEQEKLIDMLIHLAKAKLDPSKEHVEVVNAVRDELLAFIDAHGLPKDE